jgi:SAM-dependent methyltransferase
MLMSMPWVGQSIYVIAKLGVPDELGAGPVQIDELANRVGAHPDALYRFCRAMAALELFEEHEGRRFGLTEGGELLKTGAPGGLRHFAIVNGGESFRAWADVEYSVRTGKPAFELVFGVNHFDYLAAHPEASASFNAMAGPGTAPAVLDECDFSAATLIVDVGGSTGATISSVLQRYPQARGVLQDLPQAVADAGELLGREGVSDRCRVVAGSFFDSVPSGGDVYILSRVLHDWPDSDARRILAKVREAMRPDGRLVVADQVIPPGPGFHPGKLADLQMLVILGGRERSLDELRELLASSGFAVSQVHLPGAGPRAETAVEAVAA